MAYIVLGATDTTNATTLASAQSALPACYSQELDNCLALPHPIAPFVKNCDVINQGYDIDKDAMNKVIDTLPYCSESKQFSTIETAIIAGGAGLLGLALGALLK